nr:MAG TPA: hypothetical protein [Caudoviricetes sp.]DAP66597.1 MAG TPA: hypothetical protein [Caudoviricetes sp.]DAT27480.1 MAG TPA: hypothetical protein [Caudoviricetes sp.]
MYSNVSPFSITKKGLITFKIFVISNCFYCFTLP